MSEKKFDYLVQQWKSYKVDIDQNEKTKIDECFQQYVEKIQGIGNTSLTLEDYAIPKDNECSYLCNFMERTSAKFYGAAKPGNMYNYGISLIGGIEKESFFVKEELLGDEKPLGEKLKKENKKREETIYEKTVAEKAFTKISAYLQELINLSNIENIAKKIELNIDKPINATQFLRKIVAMNNKGQYLYIYSDEAITTIYDFFIDTDENKSNIEKNHEVTIKLREIFGVEENSDTIQLSKFIWSIFGSSINLEAKNMILHGAPGTGKTYSIKNTVKNIILIEGGNIDEQLVFTQFHPSYSYEDFIDGIKPNGIDEKTGQLKFELKNGNFKELCRIATIKLQVERKAKKSNSELTKFFFVADEINRAELSRVFGELLICLEEDYRIDFDEQGNIKKEESLITTQNASLDKNPVYKKGDKNYFGVPANLYFIGTMNDIDRSVDSFDMALRRRFFWKEIRCNYDFINSKFSNPQYTQACKNINRYITGYKEEKSNGKLEKVDKINSKEPLRLGTSYELGHAYFKDIQSIDNKGMEALWSSKIEPLLKEYLRAEYSQDDIFSKLQEAKEIFTLKETNDTDS